MKEDHKVRASSPADCGGNSGHPWCEDCGYCNTPTCLQYREHLEEKKESPKELKKLDGDKADLVNHPPHYTTHPSGVECIQITEHMGFNLGNAIKYIWRADLKGKDIEDLEKARWYVTREIEKRQRGGESK